ncbi:MAG: pyruvate kinase [Pseudomonadota bacterium]
MQLPPNKTKIVCTIGPASDRQETLETMLGAGMNVARLNFSHGDFVSHARTIKRLRVAAQRTGRELAIMADLPGPKIRIGELAEEPVELQIGDRFILTTEEVSGNASKVSVSFSALPRVVRPGDKLFLNDGLISLKVMETGTTEVVCEVRAGGEVRSRKGLDLPGINLGISAFTPRDRECLAFALAQGVDAVSQSFVSTADDVRAVADAAAELGHRPFVIAKIERARAMDNLQEILAATDGIMVARGDLGVEVPIARMAVVQKELMQAANQHGKPVITATQMLESMTEHRRPTRAEATDVANAILDGTDAVMLSAESAMGRYPVEAVRMLADIAAETERHRPRVAPDGLPLQSLPVVELIARSVQQSAACISPVAVMVPTRSGATARNVARFRLPAWITAVSREEATCRALQFSYGVQSVKVAEEYDDWSPFIRTWLHGQGYTEGLAVLTQGPSPENPQGNYRMEILDLS